MDEMLFILSMLHINSKGDKNTLWYLKIDTSLIPLYKKPKKKKKSRRRRTGKKSCGKSIFGTCLEQVVRVELVWNWIFTVIIDTAIGISSKVIAVIRINFYQSHFTILIEFVNTYIVHCTYSRTHGPQNIMKMPKSKRHTESQILFGSRINCLRLLNLLLGNNICNTSFSRCDNIRRHHLIEMTRNTNHSLLER